MSVSVDTFLDFEIRDVEHLDGWFAQAMQMPAWTAHLGWHGGGMLFRDRSSKGLERIHLVTYDEPSREALSPISSPSPTRSPAGRCWPSSATARTTTGTRGSSS
jgi:hypothetical protein